MFNEADLYILPDFCIGGLLDSGHIIFDTYGLDTGSIPFVQPSSLDICIGKRGYRIRSSFFPNAGCDVASMLGSLSMAELDLSESCLLDREGIYLLETNIKLDLPRGISAIFSPKSSVGRIDFFTRLVTDKGDYFDLVFDGFKGSCYFIVQSKSFMLKIQSGLSIGQLRFYYDSSYLMPRFLFTNLEAKGALPILSKEAFGEKLRDSFGGLDCKFSGSMQIVHLDLETDYFEEVATSWGGQRPVGFCACLHAPCLDLSKHGHDVYDFFRPVYFDETIGGVILNPDDFYIFATKAEVSIPGFAVAQMLENDVSLGEFRVHYAGFFDPGFGVDFSDLRTGRLKLTRAVCEVRCRDTAFFTRSNQAFAKLSFKPLLAPPDNFYGSKNLSSSYQFQSLRLAKYFGPYGKSK